MIFPIVRDGEHEDDQASEGRHEDQPVRQRGRLAARNTLRPIAAPQDRAAVAVGGAVFPAAAAGNASLETAPCVFDKMKDLARRFLPVYAMSSALMMANSSHEP